MKTRDPPFVQIHAIPVFNSRPIRALQSFSAAEGSSILSWSLGFGSFLELWNLDLGASLGLGPCALGLGHWSFALRQPVAALLSTPGLPAQNRRTEAY